MPAPPNNTNALKHGFYSRQFRAAELKDLETLAADQARSLDGEIALLRVVMRRVLNLSSNTEDADTAAKLLSVLATTAGKLAGLLKTSAILEGTHPDDANSAISHALAEIIEELQHDASE